MEPGLRVLVVEVQAHDPLLATGLLETSRRQVTRAASVAEAKARLSEHKFDLVVTDDSRLRTILDGLYAFVGVFSLDGVVVDVNRAPLAASGLDPAAVLGRRFTELPWFSHAPAERQRVADAIARAARGESSRFETNIVRTAGGLMYVDAAFAPLRGPDGAITHVLGSGVDVTARHRAEEELGRSRARLAEAQRVAHVGSWEWNVAANKVEWSDEMFAVYGLEPHDFDGSYQGFLARVHPDDVAYTANMVRHALETSSPFVYDHRVVRPDGAVRMLHTRGEVVTDSNRRPLRLVGSCWDVTERWQATWELERSREQLRALAARLDAIREEERRVMSREIHDRIGQDLTALALDFAWLRERLPTGDHEIGERTESMQRLVDNTLATARRVAAELRPVLLEDLGLREAISWQARDFEQRTGISCGVEAGVEVPATVTPGATLALYRILQEALTNITRHAGARRVSIGLVVREHELCLSIEDDGRGITEQELGRRTSLGLLGMHERALVVGGRVEVTGRKGVGTLVTARVPISPEHP